MRRRSSSRRPAARCTATTRPIPTTEDQAPLPLSPYGASKLAAEAYVRSWSAAHGVPNAVMRLGNIYGPRQTPHGEAGVVAIFSYRLWAGEPCTLFGHGSPTRDYVHVLDVVAALRAASGSTRHLQRRHGHRDRRLRRSMHDSPRRPARPPSLRSPTCDRANCGAPAWTPRTPAASSAGPRRSRSPTASPAPTRRWSTASALPREFSSLASMQEGRLGDESPHKDTSIPTTVVTGGAGFLGSHLCEALLGRGHRVLCVDNLETGSLTNIEHLRDERFVFIQHDLVDHLEIAEPIDLRAPLRQPGEPDRLPAAAAAHAQGRRLRHAQHARPGQGSPRALPARPRPARSTATRTCTRSPRATGATSIQSARAASTTRPSATRRP